MKYDALRQVAKYTRKRRLKKNWYTVLTGLAAVVVFFTVYMLMLPAITEQKDTFCGITGHIHDESCYHQVLICTSHEHDESCSQSER